METALATIETMTAVDLFKPGTLEPFLHRTRTEVLSQASTLDISTPHSRAEIASLSYKVGRTKTFIDGQRKSLVADEKKRLALIDAEGKKSWDFLEALQKEVRKPLTDWEDADKARIAAHEAAINEIQACGDETCARWMNFSAEAIRDRMAEIQGDTRDYQEFAAKASRSIADCLASMGVGLARREAYEAEAEELARLRAESAAREQKEREERIAREAVENERRATIEAEARAKVAEEARIAAEARHAQELKDAAARAEREAKAAVEAQKAADKAKADAKKAVAARREESTRIRNRVHGEITGALTAQFGIYGAQAQALIDAISNGSIPHVSITY